MTTVDDLYRVSSCPEILWYAEVDVGGPGIPIFSFGTAYGVGGIKRLDTSQPIFDFRADFSDAAVTVSAITFAIDPEDFTLRRQLNDGYWDGRPARFYIGVAGWLKEDYIRVFTGVVESLSFDIERATLAVRPANAGLRREVRQDTYLGDGSSYEGGPELKGNKKKLALGICSNVRPDLLSLGYLAFQYSEGECGGCFGVSDNAIMLVKGPDIGPLEDFAGIDPPADGTFRDQPSKGVVLLGAPPSDTSNITCNILGKKDALGEVRDTTAGCVLQLLQLAGYSLSDVDPVSYAELAAAYPYRVGIDIEDGDTYLSAIKRLLAGAHADFGVGPTGLFEFWLYRTGPSAECDLTIPTSAIVIDNDELLISRGPNLPPVNQVIINGARNNTVQEQVAQGADPQLAAFVSKAFRPIGDQSPAVLDAFPDSQTVTIDTYQYGLGDSANDSLAFYNRLAPTFLGIRGTWLATIACFQFKVRRGMRVCFETEELGLNRGSLYVERVREFVGTNLTELTLARTTPL